MAGSEQARKNKKILGLIILIVIISVSVFAVLQLSHGAGYIGSAYTDYNGEASVEYTTDGKSDVSFSAKVSSSDYRVMSCVGRPIEWSNGQTITKYLVVASVSKFTSQHGYESGEGAWVDFYVNSQPLTGSSSDGSTELWEIQSANVHLSDDICKCSVTIDYNPPTARTAQANVEVQYTVGASSLSDSEIITVHSGYGSYDITLSNYYLNYGPADSSEIDRISINRVSISNLLGGIVTWTPPASNHNGTPTPSPMETPIDYPTETPIITQTPTQNPTLAPTFTPTPSPSPTVKPTATPTPTPKPTLSPTPSPTPAPTVVTHAFTYQILNVTIPDGENATVPCIQMQSGDHSRQEQIMTSIYTGTVPVYNVQLSIDGYYLYPLGTMQPNQQASVPTYYSCLRSDGTYYSVGINVKNSLGTLGTGYTY